MSNNLSSYNDNLHVNNTELIRGNTINQQLHLHNSITNQIERSSQNEVETNNIETNQIHLNKISVFYHNQIEERAIINRGAVSNVKKLGSIRFISINPNGFRPDDTEKVQQFIERVISLQIDVALFSSSDTKWNEHTKASITSQLKVVHYKVKVIALDSNNHTYKYDFHN